MSEEEKEALIEMKSEYSSCKLNNSDLIVELETARKILNLIKNQEQKIEYLNIIVESDDDNYISKDKIREKIRELEEKGNYRDIYNPTGRVHFMKEETDYQIQVLQELLGE